jgi:hypothetical protein
MCSLSRRRPCRQVQFQAFRTVVLNEFGRNGLEGELAQLEQQVGAEERNGLGRNI